MSRQSQQQYNLQQWSLLYIYLCVPTKQAYKIIMTHYTVLDGSESVCVYRGPHIALRHPPERSIFVVVRQTANHDHPYYEYTYPSACLWLCIRWRECLLIPPNHFSSTLTDILQECEHCDDDEVPKISARYIWKAIFRRPFNALSTRLNLNANWWMGGRLGTIYQRLRLFSFILQVFYLCLLLFFFSPPRFGGLYEKRFSRVFYTQKYTNPPI